MGKSDVSARFEGVELPPYFRIVPPWRAQEARAAMGGGTLLVLSPGRAFGRGDHETTALCLIAMGYLARCGFSPRRVLDFGSGSGVLAIAAAKLGAAVVEAIDIDPVAVEAALANVEANGVGDTVAVRLGDLTSGVGGRFDVVVANILADVIVELAPDVPRVLAPGGRFITSGFVHKSVVGVAGALKSVGHRIVAHLEQGDWDALVSAPEGGNPGE